MDHNEKLQEQIDEVTSLREQFQAEVLRVKGVKKKLDAACDRVVSLMARIKATSNDELRANLFPTEKRHSDDSKNAIDGLVAVLETGKQWMSIQDLTKMALIHGVQTTSANPHRVFSTALSNERGKENPRVVLHNNKWGLPGWRIRRRRRRRRVEETD